MRVLSEGGEQGLLTKALSTQGHLLAKLGNFVESLNTLGRSTGLAEEA
jgi:hypothetical protein